MKNLCVSVSLSALILGLMGCGGGGGESSGKVNAFSALTQDDLKNDLIEENRELADLFQSFDVPDAQINWLLSSYKTLKTDYSFWALPERSTLKQMLENKPGTITSILKLPTDNKGLQEALNKGVTIKAEELIAPFFIGMVDRFEKDIDIWDVTVRKLATKLDAMSFDQAVAFAKETGASIAKLPVLGIDNVAKFLVNINDNFDTNPDDFEDFWKKEAKPGLKDLARGSIPAGLVESMKKELGPDIKTLKDLFQSAAKAGKKELQKVAEDEDDRSHFDLVKLVSDSSVENLHTLRKAWELIGRGNLPNEFKALNVNEELQTLLKNTAENLADIVAGKAGAKGSVGLVTGNLDLFIDEIISEIFKDPIALAEINAEDLKEDFKQQLLEKGEGKDKYWYPVSEIALLFPSYFPDVWKRLDAIKEEVIEEYIALGSDYEDSVANLSARGHRVQSGQLNTSGLSMNGSAGSSFAWKLPVSLTLQGDFSNKSTSNSAGLLSTKLGSTLVGVQFSYANKDVNLGQDASKSAAGVLLAQSFGAVFLQASLNKLSAVEYHESKWSGSQTSLTLGFDGALFSPFVEVSSRHLDRDGLPIRETAGFVGLDAGSNTVMVEGNALSFGLVAKLGYENRECRSVSKQGFTGSLALKTKVEMKEGFGLNAVANLGQSDTGVKISASFNR
jgi:hypothetical protein